MVSDPDCDDIISWADSNSNTVRVHAPARLRSVVLPHYYQHSDPLRFIRQLTEYGFHLYLGNEPGQQESGYEEQELGNEQERVTGREGLVSKMGGKERGRMGSKTGVWSEKTLQGRLLQQFEHREFRRHAPEALGNICSVTRRRREREAVARSMGRRAGKAEAKQGSAGCDTFATGKNGRDDLAAGSHPHQKYMGTDGLVRALFDATMGEHMTELQQILLELAGPAGVCADGASSAGGSAAGSAAGSAGGSVGGKISNRAHDALPRLQPQQQHRLAEALVAAIDRRPPPHGGGATTTVVALAVRRRKRRAVRLFLEWGVLTPDPAVFRPLGLVWEDLDMLVREGLLSGEPEEGAEERSVNVHRTGVADVAVDGGGSTTGSGAGNAEPKVEGQKDGEGKQVANESGERAGGAKGERQSSEEKGGKNRARGEGSQGEYKGGDARRAERKGGSDARDEYDSGDGDEYDNYYYHHGRPIDGEQDCDSKHMFADHEMQESLMRQQMQERNRRERLKHQQRQQQQFGDRASRKQMVWSPAVADEAKTEMADVSDGLAGRLRGMLKQHKRGDVDAAFDEFDQNQDGVLSREEFGKGLLKLGLELSMEEKDVLMSRLDRDGGGTVSFQEFARFVFADDSQGGSGGRVAWKYAGSHGNLNVYALERPDQHARTSISSIHGSNTRLFATVRSRPLAEKPAAERSTQQLEGQDPRKDQKARGVTNTAPPVAAAAAVADDESDELLKLLKLKLQAALKEGKHRSASVKTVLVGFDKNKDGLLSREEFGKGLRKLQLRLSVEEKEKLMTRVGGGGDGSGEAVSGVVSIDKFVRFVKRTKSTIEKGAEGDGEKDEKKIERIERGEKGNREKGRERRRGERMEESKDETAGRDGNEEGKEEKEEEGKEEEEEEEKQEEKEEERADAEGAKGGQQQTPIMSPDEAKAAAVVKAAEAAAEAAEAVEAAEDAVEGAIVAAADALVARRRWWEERHVYRQLSAQQRQQHPDLPGPELVTAEQRRQSRGRERAQAKAAVEAERGREARVQETRARARFMHADSSARVPVAGRQMLWDSMMQPPGIRQRGLGADNSAHQTSPSSIREGSTFIRAPDRSWNRGFENDDGHGGHDDVLKPPPLDTQSQRRAHQRETAKTRSVVQREQARWRQSFADGV
jgi:Ca2+-binding EF-hand superfamily protein